MLSRDENDVFGWTVSVSICGCICSFCASYFVLGFVLACVDKVNPLHSDYIAVCLFAALIGFFPALVCACGGCKAWAANIQAIKLSLLISVWFGVILAAVSVVM